MKYEDDFDGLLNDALREVREAEPRMGLEGRVLAGVRAGAEQRRVGWWKWAAVAVAVVVIVLAVAVRRPAKVDVVRKEMQKQVGVPEKRVESAVKVEAPKPKREVKVRSVAKVRPRRKTPSMLVAEAKLPFPVPTPLTEEEKALQRWAGRRPEVLVKLNEGHQETEEKPITISPLETEPINGGEK